MRKLFLVLPALALAGCDMFAAVSNNKWDNATPIAAGGNAVAAFQSLQATGPDTVNFVTGDGYSITATGDPETLKKLRYRLEKGQLQIGREGRGWLKGGDDKAATITITAPSLSALSLTGSGDVTADNLRGDTVKVELVGSGDIRINTVTASSIKSELAGSGDILLAGKVGSGRHEIAGSGNLDATKLAHSDANVSIVGSGSADLTASGSVKADIVGSGDVTVTGGAKCTVSKLGSGSLNCG
jgi:hypothetical protein